MLCTVIKDPVQLTPLTQMAEFRFDFFKNFSVETLKIPKIFTVREKSQGGNFKGSEEERINLLFKLSHYKPEYIDVEYTVSPEVIKKIKEISPTTKIIVSYHDFEKFPSPDSVLKEMEKLPADIYKMAFMVKSSTESLELLLFMKSHPKVLAMGMGEFGESTRILGPVFGAKFVYVSEEGRVSAEVLNNTYHFADLNEKTAVYGLIGDPVSKSLSHLTHNAVMRALKIPAVYNKFPVPKEQLTDFIAVAKKAGLKGLSVTMPLKEDIIALLDEIDPWAKKIGAVNTLKFENGRIKGFNTDGKGALEAIEESIKVKGKRIIFIGAGGAAKALIGEAIDRGAIVTILNRDKERALSLAQKMSCKGGSLDDISHEKYDILVNTTPSPMPIDPQWIVPGTVVMDIKTEPSEFLRAAQEKKCTVVFGYKMFVNQAVEQYRIWFGDAIDLKKVHEIIENGVKDGLKLFRKSL